MNSSNTTSNPHIVLVDDEPGVLSALKLLLGAIGYTVTDFIDPRAALDYIVKNQGPADVVVSDLRMPNLDGIQLVASLRERQIKIPFVLMSAHATAEDIACSNEKGANGFLSKPFTPDQFRSAIKDLQLPNP